MLKPPQIGEKVERRRLENKPIARRERFNRTVGYQTAWGSGLSSASNDDGLYTCATTEESISGEKRSFAASPVNSVMQDIHSGVHESDFNCTPYVPVYINLPAGNINKFCQLIDPEGIRQELIHIKSLNFDGVVVDCWWRIVEDREGRRNTECLSWEIDKEQAL
ncbi:beta-amylase 8-like, partial [Trifolium medium]|nr:beta-amylase 8-like [Trifolium medium]